MWTQCWSFRILFPLQRQKLNYFFKTFVTIAFSRGRQWSTMLQHYECSPWNSHFRLPFSFLHLISINCSPPGARLVRSPSRFSWVLCTTLSRSWGFDLWPIWPHIWLAINWKLHPALIDTPAIWYGVALSESDKTFQARTVICITIR